jgi:hypothetical protein
LRHKNSGPVETPFITFARRLNTACTIEIPDVWTAGYAFSKIVFSSQAGETELRTKTTMAMMSAEMKIGWGTLLVGGNGLSKRSTKPDRFAFNFTFRFFIQELARDPGELILAFIVLSMISYIGFECLRPLRYWAD